MNNRGWIRIVEAFFSILLIAGVLLIVLDNGSITGEDISSKVYDLQLSVLREIELDNSLREAILCTTTCGDPVPEGGIEESSSQFPTLVKNRIIDRMPNSLTCKSKICELEVICELNTYIDKDVYAQSVAITATIETYDPRQLKMFCWGT